MSRSWKHRIAWLFLAAIILNVIFVAMAPPVAGYYHADAWETLDGSDGYLHLHDGVVEVVNVGGQRGDWRRRVGTYQVGSRRLTVSILSPQPEILTADRGLFGLRWTTDIVPSSPQYNFCRREWFPWVIGKLAKVEMTAFDTHDR